MSRVFAGTMQKNVYRRPIYLCPNDSGSRHGELGAGLVDCEDVGEVALLLPLLGSFLLRGSSLSRRYSMCHIVRVTSHTVHVAHELSYVM